MKRFLCLAFVTLTVWVILLLSCRTAGAQTHVTFTLQNSMGTLGTNRTVWITPTSKTNVSGYSLILSDRTITNSGTGTFTVSNWNAGGYVVQVKAPPSDTFFRLLVTSTNLGTVLAQSLTTADPLDVYPDGATAWSAGSSDLRYIGAPTNSGTDGQLPQKTGDHTKWATIAGSGDVLAAGQNNFTGSNNFNGNITINSSKTFRVADIVFPTGQEIVASSADIDITSGSTGTSSIGLTANGGHVSLDGGNTVIGNGFHLIGDGSGLTNLTGVGGGSSSNNVFTTNAVGSHGVLNADIGTAAYSNSASFQPASVILSNVTANTYTTNISVEENAALAFANARGIVDPTARTHLVAMHKAWKAIGVNVVNVVGQTNITDEFFFHPRFNSGSNAVSWAGTSITYSNVPTGNWGATFTGNGLISCAMPDSRTNTLIILWRTPLTNLNVTSRQQWLGGLVNSTPANDSAQWFYWAGDALKFTLRETNTFYPAGNGLGAESLVQPFFNTGFDYNEPGYHPDNRRVTVSTCSGIGGGGIYSFYNNGVQCQYGLSSPKLYLTNTAIVPNNALNMLLLGVDTKGPSGGYFGGYNYGEIAYAAVLNAPITTNQAAEIYHWILPYVEGEKVRRFFDGDSRHAVVTSSNAVPQYFMASGQHTNEAQWVSEAVSGLRLSAFATAAFSNAYFYLNSPTGCVEVSEARLQGGINSVYPDGSSFGTVSNHLMTAVSWCNNLNIRPYFSLIVPLWTNVDSVAFPGFAWSASKEAIIDALNEFCITNSRAFAGIFRADQIGGFSELDTNLNTFSTDGVHFNGPNGAIKNRQMAEQMLGNVQPSQQSGCTVYVMSAYTAKVSDGTIYASTASGYSVKLPAIPYHGLTIRVFKSSSDANTLTVDGNGININGASTKTITAQNDGVRCVYDGTKNVWNSDNEWSTLTLASSDFANQGTATTVLHGNASGNPSWGLIDLANDVTGNIGISHFNGGSGANSGTVWRGDGVWATIGGGDITGEWHTNGNDAGTAGFIGTTNSSALRLKQNNAQVALFNSSGIVLGPESNAMIGVGSTAQILSATGGNTNFASSGSSIVGGSGNKIYTNSSAFIGGGSGNLIYGESAGNDGNAIVGGVGNKIDTNCGTSFLGGGINNRISTNGIDAVLVGGINNQAAGLNSMILGGNGNTAFGNYSFAGGYQANSAHSGAFTWSDTGGPYASVAANTFNVHAANGFHWDGGAFFQPTLTKTTNYTFTSAEHGLFVDTSGGARTMTLPASPLDGEMHWVKKVTGDANAVTLDGNGKNIDAASTASVPAQYGGLRVIYQTVPGQWYVIPGNAMTAAGLNQFGSTTSAQLAGVLSDETGSGLAVFATSPTLTTPVLGVASATSVDIGNADTTVARAAAGQLSVEGVNVPTVSSTDTLTNKRITARVTTITSSATPTVNSDNCDCVTITALAAAITSMTSSLSGTPNNFDQLEYRIKDNGTARAITWGASFVAGPAALPTTTTVSKCLHVYFEYDSVQAAWICMSSGSDA